MNDQKRLTPAVRAQIFEKYLKLFFTNAIGTFTITQSKSLVTGFIGIMTAIDPDMGEEYRKLFEKQYDRK